MTTEYKKPLPLLTEDNKPYWDACKQHELMFQKCSQCGKFRNPAGMVCPYCHSMDYSWEKVSGKGKVFTYTVFHQIYHPGFANEIPYVVASIELQEGIRMISNVVGIPPSEVACDMPVQVVFEDINDDFSLPKFKPA